MKPEVKPAATAIVLVMVAWLAALFASPQAGAVMPPRVYEKQAKESRGKAMAVLQDLAIVGQNDCSLKYRLTLKLEKSLAGPLPRFFHGTCYALIPGKNPPPGMVSTGVN